MIRIILVSATALLLAYIAWDFYARFRKASGTVRERIMAAGWESATILWSRFIMVIGAVLSGISGLADFMGAPGISAAIQKYLDPQIVGIAIIAIAVITEFARRRNSSIEPIK